MAIPDERRLVTDLRTARSSFDIARVEAWIADATGDAAAAESSRAIIRALRAAPLVSPRRVRIDT